MALCTTTRTIYGCTNASGTTCTKTAMRIFEPSAVQPNACPGSVVLSASEYVAVLDAQTNFGWNADAFDVGVQGVLMMFVTGVGIGLIVNLVRKMRTP